MRAGLVREEERGLPWTPRARWLARGGGAAMSFDRILSYSFSIGSQISLERFTRHFVLSLHYNRLPYQDRVRSLPRALARRATDPGQTLLLQSDQHLSTSVVAPATHLKHLTNLPQPAATQSPPPPHATELISLGAVYANTGLVIPLGTAGVAREVGGGEGVVVERSQRRSVESSAVERSTGSAKAPLGSLHRSREGHTHRQ